MIQVLAGEFRHRRLTSPKGTATRPTTSQVRAAVFNICQNYIDGANFLDICAGSGSMGIEAISRGAKFTTFIDSDHYAISAIYENIKTLQITKQTEVCSGEASIWLKKLKKQYDICYFDPPYTRQDQKNHLVSSVLHLLDKNDQIVPHGFIFLEESSFFVFESLELKTLVLDSKRRFGDSYLYCLRKQPKESPPIIETA